VNAGTGRTIEIGELATLVAGGFEYVPHDHPQAEIRNLRCDASRARALLGWEARTPLEEGLRRTRAWLEENRWAW
jgi:nucleoside-diphosphate-sugar epimerase